MKKNFLIAAVLILAALGMSACSDTKSCYEFTTVINWTSTTQTTSVTYEYMTKTEADAHKADLETSSSTCTYKRVSKSQADCTND